MNKALLRIGPIKLILLSIFSLLLVVCWQVSVTAAIEPQASEPHTPTIESLLKKNAALERQVRRLTIQVAAQREELNSPGISEIAGGIGYIVGIFGIAGWVSARKPRTQES